MRTNKSVNTAAAVLWASAFLLTALVIVQAGRLTGNPAYAAMTADSNDFTLLTTTSGRGGKLDPNELLYVIDGRAEFLLVYEIEQAQQRQIFLREGAYLPTWFRNARR
jgi:hypothetical protein